jgi:hypothetical protein
MLYGLFILQSSLLIYKAVYYLIYLAGMILLLINNDRTRMIAWILVLVPALGTLFNPLTLANNPTYFIGTLISFVQSLSFGDITTALLMLSVSLIPLMIIIYSITKLVKYENKKFEFICGLLFIIFFCLSFFISSILSLIFDLWPFIISIVYVGLIIAWSLIEKRTGKNKKVPVKA